MIKCDTYGTNHFKTYSAVIGERYTDFGGYFAESPMLSDNSCLDATMQMNDDAQAWHALRRKCDTGGTGLRATYNLWKGWLRKTFNTAAHAKASQEMTVRDGGAVPVPRKVNMRYFLLGIVAHGVQDSFSEEHAVRTRDWKKVSDFKTYVHTEGAPEHNHGKPIGPAHGDFIFTKEWRKGAALPVGLKPSAVAAASATAALFRAFERASANPASADQVFDAFALQWLQLDASSVRLKDNAAYKPCKSNAVVEQKRAACLKESGTDLDHQFPKISRLR